MKIAEHHHATGDKFLRERWRLSVAIRAVVPGASRKGSKFSWKSKLIWALRASAQVSPMG